MHPSILEIRANMLDLLAHISKLGNIDDDVSSIRVMTDKITEKRNKLKNILPKEEFENSSKYFETITKQIRKKLDNLIDRKTIEQQRIAGELKLMNNKRKLSKYSR
jgi:hypothetical protein